MENLNHRRKATRTATGRPVVPLRGLTSAPLRGEAPLQTSGVATPPTSNPTRPRTSVARERPSAHAGTPEAHRSHPSRGTTTTLLRTGPNSDPTFPLHGASAHNPQALHQAHGQTMPRRPPGSPARPLDPDLAERERRAKHARLAVAREPPSFSPSFGKTADRAAPTPLMSPTREGAPPPDIGKKAHKTFDVCADAPGGRVIR